MHANGVGRDDRYRRRMSSVRLQLQGSRDYSHRLVLRVDGFAQRGALLDGYLFSRVLEELARSRRIRGVLESILQFGDTLRRRALGSDQCAPEDRFLIRDAEVAKGPGVGQRGDAIR